MTNMMAKLESPDDIYIGRVLSLPALLEKKSLFLLGPRQTGKTSLIHHTLKGAKVYDLLNTSVFLAMSQNPGRLAQELTPKDRFVVIDEIQRLPILLNEVHRLIGAPHSLSAYRFERQEAPARRRQPAWRQGSH